MLIGLAVGLAVYNGVFLDVSFPMALYKKLLSLPVGFEDVAGLSPTVQHSLTQLLSYQPSYATEIEDMFALTFSATVSSFGTTTEVDLVPNGKDREVTEANRREYVEVYTDYMLNTSVERGFDAFRQGFLMLTGGAALPLFRPEELEAMVMGTPHLDFQALRKACKYEGFGPDDQVIQWLWQVLQHYENHLLEETRIRKKEADLDRTLTP